MPIVRVFRWHLMASHVRGRGFMVRCARMRIIQVVSVFFRVLMMLHKRSGLTVPRARFAQVRSCRSGDSIAGVHDSRVSHGRLYPFPEASSIHLIP